MNGRARSRPSTARQAVTQGLAPRLEALDIMRGVAVAAMIVVNNPGNWNAVYPPLVHAAWNGATFADLVFPAFIFIMGVAAGLAGTSSARSAPRSAFDRRTIKRVIVLIGLGLALNAVKAWPHLETMRIPGVLQRIAVTYVFTAAILRLTAGRPASRWFITLALMMAHWWLLAASPWSHTPISPGANLAVVVDQSMFGEHLLSPSGDPEGVLGVMSSIASALLGAALGVWLNTRNTAVPAATAPPLPAYVGVALAGAALLAVGYAWSFLLPFNKFLWTGPFAVFTSGAAALALSTCMVLSRLPAATALRPFQWLGTNALAVYVFSELGTSLLDRPWLAVDGQRIAAKELLFWGGLVPRLGGEGDACASLVYAVLCTSFWVGVAALMRWSRVRIRVWRREG